MSTLQRVERLHLLGKFSKGSERALRQITRSARLMGKSDVGPEE